MSPAPIQYRFQFSEDHLLTAFLRCQQQARWWRPLFWIRLGLGAVVGLFVVFLLGRGRFVPAAIFGSIAAALCFFGRLNAWLLRRRFRRSPYHDDPITFSLSEGGAHAVGRDSDIRIGWATFTRARRFEDGLLLFQGPGVCNWLPDSAADAATVTAAQALVRAHIRDYRER